MVLLSVHPGDPPLQAGLEYERLAPSLVEGTLGGRLEGAGATREDVAEIEALVREHFNLGEKEGSRPVVTKVEREAVLMSLELC